MMHSSNSLYDMLKDTLVGINSQLAATVEDLEKKIADLPYPDEVTVYRIKNHDGRFVLTDLLVAKANVLQAMAALKAAEMQQKAAKR